MKDSEEVKENIVSCAARDLPPIRRTLAARLGLGAAAPESKTIGHGLSRAYVSGFRAGYTEVVTQLVAQGVEVPLRKLPEEHTHLEILHTDA